ncbi:hypothetical protein JCM19240_5137 [Vibrio maritimus]|uniref:Uncharacterized protein n=1 Tax=Vibrio maritimus TaxID=990268 RepID=A0A090SVI7_9VIBR|nr:hypothetical protein JCM19240_5137 [Vibrio maritimus]
MDIILQQMHYCLTDDANNWLVIVISALLVVLWYERKRIKEAIERDNMD